MYPFIDMRRVKLAFVLIFIVCIVACTSRPHPEAKLVGKWEETDSKILIPAQFEFFADGTVIQNQKISGKWSQLASGTYKILDNPMRLKLELQPNWYFGVTIYQITWQDGNHINLQAADNLIHLSRSK